MGAIMMKKTLKQGFTLVELLICIAVIGVVSALGMNITKHSTAKAYKLFYYSAYTNLYDAICYAEENKPEEVTGDSIIDDKSEFIKLLNAALGKTDNQGKTEDPENGNTITTANGIKYTIQEPTDDACLIVMQVPQAKTKQNNGFETVNVVYKPSVEDVGSLLIPVEGGSVNLQNRRDLLPFYIDDGLNNNKEIAYFPFDEAYCKVSNNTNLASALPLTNIETALIPEDVMFRFMKVMATTERKDRVNAQLEAKMEEGGGGGSNGFSQKANGSTTKNDQPIYDCEYPATPGTPGTPGTTFQPTDTTTTDSNEGGKGSASMKVPTDSTGSTGGGSTGDTGITVPSTLVNCAGKTGTSVKGIIRVADPRKAR